MKLIMTLGLPASGKSTWASQQGAVVVTKDDIREGLAKKDWKFDKEKETLRRRDVLISEALSKGKNVISADTNFNPIHRTRLEQIARKYKAEFAVQSFLDVPVLTCIERDAGREGEARVGERVIRDMAERYLGLDTLVPGRQDRQLFVDLDGVLADFDGFIAKEFGIENNRENERPDFWDIVGGYRGRLYYDMQPFPKAKAFWASLKAYSPVILSGAPFGHFPNAGFDKRAWVKEHIDPDAYVVTCKSRNKRNYAKAGDVLIDDWEKYKNLWPGTWITHKGDYKETLDNLKKVW